MTTDQFKNLAVGDIVEQVATGDVYVIAANSPGAVIGVRAAYVLHEEQWALLTIKTTEAGAGTGPR